MRERREREILELPQADTFAARPALPPAGYEGTAGTYRMLEARAFLVSVWNHPWLIAGCVVLATTFAAAYVALQPALYEAHGRVQVDLERPNQALGSPSKGETSVVNDPTYFSTQLQILTGPGLLRRVVKTLDLEHNEAFLHPGSREGGARAAGEEALLVRTVAPAAPHEDLAEAKRLAPYVEAIQARLAVEPVKESRLKVSETRLIDISFRHGDPVIAAKVVNAVADSFVLSNFERKNEAGATSTDFLGQRVAELKEQIRAREEQLINYAKSHEILSLDASQDTVVERLAGLNKQLLEAENERETAEAAYRAALAPKAAEALAEDSAKQVAADESRLAELRQRRAQLLVEFKEEWPEVKEVEKQIAVLERHVAQTRGRAVAAVKTNLETRYNQALRRERALRAAFERQKGKTLTQNEAAINYRIIQQEIETNKGLLNTLLQRAKESEVMLAGTQNNVHVVDYAIAPGQPVSPRPLLSILLALGLSLGFGVCLAVAVDYWDDSLRSTGEVEKALGIPALTVIPSVVASAPTRLLAATSRLPPAANALQKWGGGPRPELLLGAGVRSPLAEIYRHLRTSVLLSADGRAPGTLLVTSSQPGEGKTTTAINVAISFAQTGASVLLIDADMRKPKLGTILGLGNRRGLSDYLSGEAGDELPLLVQSHQRAGLHVLPAGTPPSNPAELLGSERMRDLLKILKQSFRYIIIDSPPIVPFSDGVLISAVVDGVLLVVQGGKVSREIVRHSQRSLEDVGARVLGVILNNVNLSPSDYYNYQRWRDYQRSYQEPDAAVPAAAE